MNAAILLSGGIGTRINSDIPKQYIRIGDHMTITYALGPLISTPLIHAIYIVAAEEYREDITSDAGKLYKEAADKIKGFADPGVNRQGSILSGMEKILDDMGSADASDISDDDTVLVHDACRPGISAELIAACYGALEGCDGVMPALPMKDTVYLGDAGDRIGGLLDRSRIYAGQAPELFRLGKYHKANLALLPDKILKINGASEPAVMAGMDIRMIPGDEANYKITTDADLARFRESMERAESRDDRISE